jgi:hypothetical protein
MHNSVLREQEYGRLNCFNPPVMVATFLVEIVLAIYSFWRYKFSTVTRLVGVLLIFLAVFQLAEFMVCEGDVARGLEWSRLGYIAITTLPPVGLHLTMAIAKAPKKWYLMLIPAYGTMLTYMIFFGYISHALVGHQCLGNYVIFQISNGMGWLYGSYYYGWILMSLVLGVYWESLSRQKKIKKALIALLSGYLAFLIPTALVSMLSKETLRGIPSVMCGFAVIMAIAVAIVVLPYAAQKRR